MQSNHKYAKTVFEICKKANNISLIQNQLQVINYLFNKIASFRLVLITKRLNQNDKINILDKSLSSFNPLVIEFLSILIQNNQINNLPNIISRFNNMANAFLGVNKINIITASKLSNDDFDSIVKSISQKLNTKPQFNTITDPEMIGGIKLRIGNNIFDNSVSYQINQLKKTLHKV